MGQKSIWFFIGYYLALNEECNPGVQGKQINCALQIPQMKFTDRQCQQWWLLWLTVLYQPKHIYLFIYIICNTTADQLKIQMRWCAWPSPSTPPHLTQQEVRIFRELFIRNLFLLFPVMAFIPKAKSTGQNDMWKTKCLPDDSLAFTSFQKLSPASCKN